MSEMPVEDAREHLDDVVARAAETGEVVYLTKRGKRVAAIMTADEATHLEGLRGIAEYEAEYGPIPEEELRKARETMVREGLIPD